MMQHLSDWIRLHAWQTCEEDATMRGTAPVSLLPRVTLDELNAHVHSRIDRDLRFIVSDMASSTGLPGTRLLLPSLLQRADDRLAQGYMHYERVLGVCPNYARYLVLRSSLIARRPTVDGLLDVFNFAALEHATPTSAVDRQALAVACEVLSTLSPTRTHQTLEGYVKTGKRWLLKPIMIYALTQAVECVRCGLDGT